MKRILTVVFGIIAILAVVGTATVAYFTHEESTKNTITAGNIDFEILEKTDKGESFPIEGVDIMPGDKVSKIVTVKNISDHPLYVRIKLTKSVNDPSLDAEIISMNINKDDWTLKEDGYYYYAKSVAAGEETTSLFTEVSVDGPNVGNEYLGKTFSLKIDGYAVQSENNGTDVFSAIGWPKPEQDD